LFISKPVKFPQQTIKRRKRRKRRNREKRRKRRKREKSRKRRKRRKRRNIYAYPKIISISFLFL